MHPGRNNMRSDYILYGVAVIFFVLTAAVLTYQVEQQSLWIVTTAVLGLLFIGLGYSQKPRATISARIDPVSTPIMTTPTQTLVTRPEAQPTPITEPASEPIPEQITQPETLPTPSITITQVKGVKEKRAQQLRELGINTIQDLASASPEKLGKDLQLSPKITAKWVEYARQLTENS
jgi:predicted flap endonuclease-1-like 5' DNA nuclease